MIFSAYASNVCTLFRCDFLGVFHLFFLDSNFCTAPMWKFQQHVVKCVCLISCFHLRIKFDKLCFASFLQTMTNSSRVVGVVKVKNILYVSVIQHNYKSCIFCRISRHSREQIAPKTIFLMILRRIRTPYPRYLPTPHRGIAGYRFSMTRCQLGSQ